MFGKRVPPKKTAAEDVPVSARAEDSSVCGQELRPNISELADYLQGMCDDAAAIALKIKNQMPLTDLVSAAGDRSVIRYDGIDRFFKTVAEDGSAAYRIYYYSQDMKSLDPLAQANFAKLVSQAIIVDGLVNQMITSTLTNGEGGLLIVAVDRIIAMTTYLKHSLHGFTFSTDLLLGRLQGDTLNEAARQFIESYGESVKRAMLTMVQPAAFGKLVPYQNPRLLIEVTRRDEEGQKFVNGVYFPKDLVDTLIADTAQRNSAILFSPKV
ncbi:MAG: hypothetical protein AAF299_18555 [Pseudomonadota bacterium]